MFECYSFRVGIRGYNGRQLRLQETSTQFSQDGGTYSFPDGFTLFEQDKEVGRVPLEEVEICHDHENCFIGLPSMFRLELRSSSIVVLLDEQQFTTAMRSSAAQLLDAYRVIPILMHRLSELCNIDLGSVQDSKAEDDALLTRDQKQLCHSMKAMGNQSEIPESTVIRIGNTSFWADLGQNCIVERPNTRMCKLECDGGLVVSQPGYGRKRAVLAYARALAQPVATEQEQETLMCHFPVGVICNPIELDQWMQEATLLSAAALAIPDFQTLCLLSYESFCRFDVVIISSKLFESSGFWARPPEFRDNRFAAFRRCDWVMLLRQIGKLDSSFPLLDLVYWKSLIFAEPIKPLITKNFRAAQRWVLLPGSNLPQLHRAWELIQPESEADFPLHSFAKAFGLYWEPSTEHLPKLNKQTIVIQLNSTAKSYLLQDSWSSDTVCGAIKRRKMILKRDKISSAILANNQAHLRKLEAYTKKLRAQEKLWHNELERDYEPSEWDSSLLGDWSVVREQIVQAELDAVEASLKLLKKTHQLFSRVEHHHLETALGEQCPVCGDENEAIFRCGHGTCWSCVYTLFKEKKQIKCPQCRSSLVKGDVWLVETDQGETKFQALARVLEKTEKPCLILMQTNNGCKALQRALPQFAIETVTDPLADSIYVGKYSALAHRHLPLKHLILMHPMGLCDPMIQHIGNPYKECQTTCLLYKEFETAV